MAFSPLPFFTQTALSLTPFTGTIYFQTRTINRIYFKNLMEYKAQQKAESKKIMARLARLSQEMGLME